MGRFTQLLVAFLCTMAFSSEKLAAESSNKGRAFSTSLQVGQHFAVTASGCRLSVPKETSSRITISCSRRGRVQTGSARIILARKQYGVINARDCNLSVAVRRAGYVDVQCLAIVTPRPIDTAPLSIVSTPISETPTITPTATATPTATYSPTVAQSGMIAGKCYVNGLDTGEVLSGNGFCSATGLMYENGAPANSVILGVLYQNGVTYDGVYKGGLYKDGIKISISGSLDSQTFQNRGFVSSEAGIRAEANVIPVDMVVADDGAITVAGYSTSETIGGDYLLLTRYLKDGSLDEGFGQKGVVDLSQFSPISGGDLFFANNKYFVLMWDRVIRLNYDGSLDQSFATNGLLEWFKLGNVSNSSFLVPERDGGILLGAFGPYMPIKMVRFTSSGEKDLSFGSNGELSIPRTAYNVEIATQADGKRILAVWYDSGTPKINPTGDASQLIRLNSDGSFDKTFGNQGIVDGPNALYTKILPLADGRFLALQSSAFKIVGFLEDGQIDSSFGSKGEALIPSRNQGDPNGFWGEPGRKSIAVLPDGKLLIGSISLDPAVGYSSIYVLLARYTAGGVLDATFDQDGLKQLDFAEAFNTTVNMLVTCPDGRVVGAGTSRSQKGAFDQMLIFRLWS